MEILAREVLKECLALDGMRVLNLRLSVNNKADDKFSKGDILMNGMDLDGW